MKMFFACFISMVVFSFTMYAQKKDNKYHFVIDLTTVANDQVNVELRPPVLKNSTVVYHLPKTVPGTYSITNYGRFVKDFKAYNAKGDTLSVTRLDENSWQISSAGSLAKILYKINDTFDDQEFKEKVFGPTGSNTQLDTNYLINNHCYLGYFDDIKKIPYEVQIKHPKTMYGSTPLTDLDKSAVNDRFEVEDYNKIVDNPFMYGVPDTSIIQVGKSKVLISVYSPNKKVSASFLAGKIGKLLAAQSKYLGGTLPVDKYAFLIYLTDKTGPLSVGALEHSYSSVYYMPEGDPENIAQFFLDVAAHEFFHIITPLNLHSEEIAYFDFAEPKISKHLWLYEGTTEYHAHIAQEKYGLTTKDAFLKVLQKKINNTRFQYIDTLPFTVMSANVLLDKYANQYGNVYEKGALIAMCLDIKLLELSKGKMGIMDMINSLTKKYGKSKPFKDDQLFDDIEKMTYPEIRAFINKYVDGPTPLPLEETLASVGITLVRESIDSSYELLQGLQFGQNPETKRLIVRNISQPNGFSTRLGLKVGDEIASINQTNVTAANTSTVWTDWVKAFKPGEMVSVNVIRKDANGAAGTVTLTSPMIKVAVKKRNQMSFNPSATAEQLALQKAWLGN
jgi:predicted metalloprotease with PDZ domain